MAALAPGAITDVDGIEVGHATHAGRPTGCTVVLCGDGAVGGVAVRGGSPGTRETDLLRPENTVDRVHAVLLAGGSAFGLDAASGVVRWLETQGRGLRVGAVRVPIVPAAVLFDLALGDARIRPDADTGFAACLAASAALPAQGNAGAGQGATIGKAFGMAHAMKGGIGTASLQAGGFRVGALVAVNAVGDVIDAQGRVIAGARDIDGRLGRSTTARLLAGETAAVPIGTATTIGVVATDAQLDKARATQLASLAHAGIARAVDPLTERDGDTLFTLGTGARAADDGALTLLGAMAAEAVARAIRNAVRAATAVELGSGAQALRLPAARDR